MKCIDLWYSIKNHLLKKQLIQYPKSGIILDVGPGGTPLGVANLLLEKFLSNNFERNGDILQIDDRFIIKSDLARLPFKNQSIDFLNCLHVLEHVEDPAYALNEIQRVAKAGYIETPSAGYEKIASWPFHRWFVSHDKKENKMIFKKKDRRIFDQDIENFRDVLINSSIGKSMLYNRYINNMLVVYPWKNKINFQVDHTKVEIVDEKMQFSQLSPEDDSKCYLQHSPKKKIWRILWSKWMQWKRKKNQISLEQLADILRCPSCQQDLTFHQNDYAFNCPKCLVNYPVKGQVVFFE